ncbi:MAG: energy-coupling factor transporter transmembrane protein EcfT [Candidatus Pristimantibacillus sp.]
MLTPQPPQPKGAGTAAAPASPLASRFDPRALIIAYLLIASAILLQSSWGGIAAAAVIIAAALYPMRSQIRPWIKVIRAYIILIAVVTFIAGLHIQPLSFDYEQALQTAVRFSGLLLAMLLGLPLFALVTPLRVQRALEQTFGWLSRFHVPVASFALTVTLIFRFIPLLAEEWGRFAKIAHARGKAVTPAGSLPISMLPAAVIPYIRSLLRMAEQMADALEARGIGNPNVKPTRGFRLRFSRIDGLLMALSILASALLYYCAAVW